MLLYLLLLEGGGRDFYSNQGDETKQSALVVFVIALLSVCVFADIACVYATMSWMRQ